MAYAIRFTAVSLVAWSAAGLWVSELAHVLWMFYASLAVAGLAVVVFTVETVRRHG